jgi:hypothetical protein
MACKISILFNVILLVCLWLLWVHPQNRIISSTPPMSAKAEVPAQPPIMQAKMETNPFRWGQLLSSNNYLSFVTNLRAAGCPESTVEDIVRGDTDRAYSMMRGHLGINPAEPGPWSSQAEVQMVAYFLGQKPAPALKVAATPALAPPTATPPLVLQNVDLTALKLDGAQTQAIAGIRETFLDNVGGVNQDTNDPAYLARWQKAEYQADTMLQAMLGEQAFAQYQVQAYQLSLLTLESPAGN